MTCPFDTAARIHALNTAPGRTDTAPPRAGGARYLGGFCAPPLETVRLALAGLGERSAVLIAQLAALPHAAVVGLCDINPDAVHASVAQTVEALPTPLPQFFSGEDAYTRMLDAVQPDAVIICTNWGTHAPMAIQAMEHGAHALVEVPLGNTLQELWRVVDTAERTQKHCMMLENCNYGRDELMFLNMVRQGIIGNLLHGEAAYIHDLRERQMLSGSAWRMAHFSERNGNLYPTHGLGPLAQYMSIGRTEDTFDRIVSYSSPALGRAAFAEEKLYEDHEWNRADYNCGDINTSIIKTRLGRTILVQWDETSPRPYDRRNLIQGTHGTLAGFPTRAAGCGINDGSAWLASEAEVAELRLKYEHPLWKRLGAEALRHDPRGGMNYLLFARIIECLHHGLPLDQNVYEGALWSAVAPLTEKSVSEGGAPQLFPDFTRGAWSTTAPLGIVE